MKITYEILNDGAFVVTRNEQNELLLGFYHNVFSQGDVMRIFEPIAPIDFFSPEEIINYIQEAT